jgi:hypothetical protein
MVVLRGLLLTLGAIALTFIISFLVIGIIALMYRLGKSNKPAGPSK